MALHESLPTLNTRGYIARLEDGRTVLAPSAREMISQLRAAGITETEMLASDDYDGDWSLSAAPRQALSEAWRQSD